MNTKLTFGEYVRHLRRKKSWGLQELAQHSGLSSTHLSRLENDNAIPTADTVVKLAASLQGDLSQMLALAKCLPKEILNRLVRRASASGTHYSRTAGVEPDPGYPRVLVEDIDPQLKAAIAQRFDLPENDVDGVFQVLSKMAQMTPEERDAMVRLFGANHNQEGPP